ncbi:hypothetical protein DM02DRAFT_609169 [Periconia macrospinosa]|uniref:Uncharacterized protein n=1 Tax=Periconia macrospinosa TaxID=97972 RepID=A0A2V1E997_9PLEO|nr:hypothetical protein DM02DRAFT_609169 [Periconia macrospinosa]
MPSLHLVAVVSPLHNHKASHAPIPQPCYLPRPTTALALLFLSAHSYIAIPSPLPLLVQRPLPGPPPHLTSPHLTSLHPSSLPYPTTIPLPLSFVSLFTRSSKQNPPLSPFAEPPKFNSLFIIPLSASTSG